MKISLSLDVHWNLYELLQRSWVAIFVSESQHHILITFSLVDVQLLLFPDFMSYQYSQNMASAPNTVQVPQVTRSGTPGKLTLVLCY